MSVILFRYNRCTTVDESRLSPGQVLIIDRYYILFSTDQATDRQIPFIKIVVTRSAASAASSQSLGAPSSLLPVGVRFIELAILSSTSLFQVRILCALTLLYR